MNPGGCRAVVVALVGTLAGGLAGCSASPPDVSAADLQARIAQTLTDGGIRGAAVRCDNNLPAQLGTSVNCEVTFSPADRVRAVATTTSVAGEKHEYELQPRLIQSQVESRVADIARARSATCERGLEPVVGDRTRCEVNRAGVNSERIVEVTGVEGLRIGLRSTLVVNQGKVEDVLSRRLAAAAEPAPDAVTCDAGLLAEKGATTECVATYGDMKTPYSLTVSGFSDDAVDFDYAPREQKVSPSSSSTVRSTPEPTAPSPAAEPPSPVEPSPTAEPTPPVEPPPPAPAPKPPGGAIGLQPKSG